MIALVLAATLTPPHMFGYFVDEMKRQAIEMRMSRPPDVMIDFRPVELEGESWAWVVPCDRECQPLVIVKADVLRVLGYEGVRVLVRHELVHIRRQDHLDPEWLDLSKAGRSRTRWKHLAVELEVRQAFDKTTLEAAATEVRWADEMLRRK